MVIISIIKEVSRNKLEREKKFKTAKKFKIMNIFVKKLQKHLSRRDNFLME